jgi:hypothetical protein
VFSSVSCKCLLCFKLNLEGSFPHEGEHKVRPYEDARIDVRVLDSWEIEISNDAEGFLEFEPWKHRLKLLVTHAPLQNL